MKRDLLWEVGMEEVPSGFMPGILGQLEQLAQNNLDKARLTFDAVHVLGTPRRMVLWVEGLAEQQADSLIENRGPKKQAAYDAEGNPTKALLGFAKGQGLSIEELEVRTVGEVEYLFAVKTLQGGTAQAALPDLLDQILHGLNFPKSMRWGYHALRFVRPIRWMLTLYGEEIVPFTVENISSGRVTYGHRFLSSGPLTVEKTADYFSLLEQHYVIADPAKRLAVIREQIAQVAKAQGGSALENEGLMEEVNFLVEYPTAFYGQFSPSYLSVPTEVLTTTMVNNQKYFPVFAEDGKLLPGFIGVRNGTDASLSVVAAGNERVLRARLEDALFFWQEDLNKSLEAMGQGLAGVMFHEKLGSMEKKVERLERLAEFIGSRLGLSSAEWLQRAAVLGKADLLSSMVYEFPELQGIMGRYYAQHQGEKPEIAEAILEHYMPRFAGDQLPKSATGVALALAEKIDNLVGFFTLGAKPSGSQDPYALRRQALGIVHIMLAGKYAVDLKELIEFAYEQYAYIQPEFSLSEVSDEIIAFVHVRMKGVLQEKGFSYDVIDAVLASSGGRIYEAWQKSQAISDCKKTDWFEDFLTVYNRSQNLSKKWNETKVEMEHLMDATEKTLWEQMENILPQAEVAGRTGDYVAAMQMLSQLRPNLDAFFNAVMVMVDDESIKANRLGMLKAIAEAGNKIAYFSFLVV